MRITNDISDDAALAELGNRLRQARLNQGISQAELAGRAGFSELTLRKIEAGALGQTRNLIRALRVLGYLENLEIAVPEALPSPIAQSDNASKMRRRAPRHRRDKGEAEWTWGDEES